MNGRRVVVTGLGCLSPLGLSVEENWNALLAAKSGIRTIDAFDVSAFSTRIAGQIRGFDLSDRMVEKQSKRVDDFIHYGLATAQEALASAGLIDDDRLKQTIFNERAGVCVGSGIGGLNLIENTVEKYLEKGPRKITPFYIPGAIINMLAGMIAIHFGLKGPNVSPVSACTTGTHAISWAARMIAYGEADLMLTGSSEKACTPTAMGGFASARALSTRNDEPTKASRPWDKDRDGFVLADGSGVIVLESLEHAINRGAPIIAELVGVGYSGDAHHMTSPPEDGEGAARCMANAIKDSGVDKEAFDYINAHGTSTPAGDIAEIKAIKKVFGSHSKKLAISSTKSMSGHLLGASGSVEAVYTCLSIQHQMIPPTINLDHPDEGCDLDLVPHTARAAQIRYALSNSFGFGGSNGTLAFARYEP